jgi:hypothetical protein
VPRWAMRTATISFTVGEGVQKENKMRFLTLIALTLVLTLAAGTAQAQGGLSVTRTIHLESDYWAAPSDTPGGDTVGGEPKGKFTVALDNEDFGGGSGFQLNLRSFSCPGAVNWVSQGSDHRNLSLQSRVVWVLFNTLGDDGRPPAEQKRRIITFRPDCSSYGTTWAQTQINGYLIDDGGDPDGDDPDGDPWNGRVMTDSLLVEVVYEVIDADPDPTKELPRVYFTGCSPDVVDGSGC